ncbi:MAG: biotin--[Alphaproteobacteria bacterium]|nr:biotin--[acetyl-CoA-carboxylase] ligase [Alphaproteobacteria bacterium]
MLYTSKEIIENYECYEFEELTSTNDEIKNIKDLSIPTLITAINQTNGRGRRARNWTPILGNLYFSYNIELSPKDLSKFVCLIGLSLAKTIKQLSSTLDIKIKWPNDVMVNNNKISGILIENISGNYWVVGIGVNIVDSPNIENASYQATSLKEQGIILDRKDFLRYYLKNFNQDYKQYLQFGFENIRKQWLELALNINKTITIQNEDISKKGEFITIDDNGYLILKTKDKEEKIIAGDLFI